MSGGWLGREGEGGERRGRGEEEKGERRGRGEEERGERRGWGEEERGEENYSHDAMHMPQCNNTRVGDVRF